jgi:hypothetical protein
MRDTVCANRLDTLRMIQLRRAAAPYTQALVLVHGARLCFSEQYSARSPGPLAVRHQSFRQVFGSFTGPR